MLLQKTGRHESLQLLPLDPLERAACHVEDASCGTSYHADEPLPEPFEEAGGTFLFGSFRHTHTHNQTMIKRSEGKYSKNKMCVASRRFS